MFFDKMNKENPQKDTVLSEAELIQKLETWFAVGSGPFPLSVTGHSMVPFILPERDTAFLFPCTGKVKTGDVVLVLTSNGRLLLHRVKKTDGEKLVTAGDALGYTDESSAAADVIAVCRRVERKGRVYGEKSLYWLFFSEIWIHLLPLRKFLTGGYAAMKKSAGKLRKE